VLSADIENLFPKKLYKKKKPANAMDFASYARLGIKSIKFPKISRNFRKPRKKRYNKNKYHPPTQNHKPRNKRTVSKVFDELKEGAF
jgi:hypothetical protein